MSGIGFLGAGIILRDGINVHGLNTAATLWCSAMVGTIAGAGDFAASLLAAAFVVGTNLLLRPLVRRINRLSVTTADAETFYTVQIVGPAQPRAAGFRHELAGRSQRGHRRGDAGTGASDAPRAGVPLARSRGYQT